MINSLLSSLCLFYINSEVITLSTSFLRVCILFIPIAMAKGYKLEALVPFTRLMSWSNPHCFLSLLVPADYTILYLFSFIMELLSETRPANSKLLSGTLPANSKLLSGTLPANSKLLSGTLPANNKLLSGTLPANNKLW